MLFAPSLIHFFPRLNKIKFGKISNSEVIVNKLCYSWRKDFNRSWAIIKYMFSNYGEFSFFDRTKTWLNYILWCWHLHALLRVFCQSRVFCFSFKNSKLLYNRLTLQHSTSLKTCYLVITFVEYFFQVALHVDKKS